MYWFSIQIERCFDTNRLAEVLDFIIKILEIEID